MVSACPGVKRHFLRGPVGTDAVKTWAILVAGSCENVKLGNFHQPSHGIPCDFKHGRNQKTSSVSTRGLHRCALNSFAFCLEMPWSLSDSKSATAKMANSKQQQQQQRHHRNTTTFWFVRSGSNREIIGYPTYIQPTSNLQWKGPSQLRTGL